MRQSESGTDGYVSQNNYQIEADNHIASLRRHNIATYDVHEPVTCRAEVTTTHTQLMIQENIP